MAKNSRRARPSPEDLELQAQASADALRDISRASALRCACTRSELAWVRDAYTRGVIEAKCLGRFDLVGASTPWPSIMFLVARPDRPGIAGRVAALAVYVNPEGRWEVSSREPKTGADLHVDWRQYAGDHTGKRGVINGDDAGDGEVEAATPMAERRAERDIATPDEAAAILDDMEPINEPRSFTRERRSTGPGPEAPRPRRARKPRRTASASRSRARGGRTPDSTGPGAGAHTHSQGTPAAPGQSDARALLVVELLRYLRGA